MTQNSPTSTTASETPSYPSPEGRTFVLISIAVVAVMFVGMVGLLYWHERPAPSALLILRVPMAQDGAIATIDTADGRDLSPIVETLKGGEAIRIPLPPGEYTAKIEHLTKKIRAQFKITLTENLYFPIIMDDPATQPATRPTPKR
jgi:hypothetical protein